MVLVRLVDLLASCVICLAGCVNGIALRAPLKPSPQPLPAALQAILDSPSQPDVITMSCDQLAPMVTPNDFQYMHMLKNPLQDVVMDVGADCIILAALQQFPNNTRLHDACINMFFLLALWNPPIGLKLGDEGVIDIMVNRAEVNGNWQPLSTLVDFLPLEEVNLQRIVDTGAVTTVMDDLRESLKTNNRALAHSAVFFFCNVCASPDAKEIMIKSDWIPFTVQMMREFPNEGGIRGEIIWDNDRCFADSAEHCNLLADEGFFEEVVKIMQETNNVDPDGAECRSIDAMGTRRTFQNSLDIIRKCAQTNVTHQEKLLQAGASEVIVDGMKRGMADQRSACDVLKILGKSSLDNSCEH
mmetsp:Transcript_103681/g.231534  ORF Transcript_103681/g.231534 Transcript_103681/m.231534 type:complete len:357 (+) Transcript_103681:59-1129(+)